jgi:type IV secretion system protein VirD4
MGHILTCAPTGAGKGIGAVIPNLLTYPGSAFVLDLKGENFAVHSRPP